MNIYERKLDLNNISGYDKCANCGACYNICPTSAIRIEDGCFYSVIVDDEKCINCGKCIDVCPVNKLKQKQNIIAGYSAVHREKEVVISSSSGGVFSALAEHIVEQGGVVWGAGYAANFQQITHQSTSKTSIDKLRGSKYVESLVGNSFREIKSTLDSGRLVLFCGAPCQVAGLKRYIGERDNLYTADFTCGGLAAHGLYQEWINNLKEKYKAEITNVNFRSKYFGWGTHCICVEFENGKKYLSPAGHDPFFSSFLNGRLSVRNYCYQCQFSNNHYSDLILADYWRYKDVYSKTNKSGLSLVLVNSQKGQALLDRITNRVQLEQIPLNLATYNIKETKTNTNRCQKREEFIKEADHNGLIAASTKYCLPKWYRKFYYILKVYLKKFIQGSI